MKLNCNHLSIGAPGTGHINWESAGGMVARRLQGHIVKIGSDFYAKRGSKTGARIQNPKSKNVLRVSALARGGITAAHAASHLPGSSS